MKHSTNGQVLVTIVVIQRERFSFTRQSLEGIYENAVSPFKLVYVDGGSPRKWRKYLDRQSSLKGFKLIRSNGFLSPTKARNMGLRYVKTKYVVFIDNDVAVERGWLKTLVDCAEQTKASVVGPLIVETWNPRNLVHYGGGEAGIFVKTTRGKVRRHLFKKVYHNSRPADIVHGKLTRQRCWLFEFHCALIRTETFNSIGLLDEKLSCEDHTDFSIRVVQAGGTIYFEPKCYVTYVSSPVTWSDISFYMLRWSDAWQLASYERLRAKWNVEEDKFFSVRYKRIGDFRLKHILRPFSHRLLFGFLSQHIEKLLLFGDRKLNRHLMKRYDVQEPNRTEKWSSRESMRARLKVKTDGAKVQEKAGIA